MKYIYITIFSVGAIWEIYNIFYIDIKEKNKSLRKSKIEKAMLLILICIYIIIQLISG